MTYAGKVEKEELRLDFARDAASVEQQVRAFNPPGAWFEIAGERVRVLACDVLPLTASSEQRIVVDDRLTIACAAGAVRPTLVQRAGRGVTTAAELLRGFPIAPGTCLV